jgi:hypothetical protein
MSRMQATRTDRLKTVILLLAVAGLTSGLAVWFAGQPEIANMIWIAGVTPALAALVVEIIRSLRSGDVGLDIVAALSMSAALTGESLPVRLARGAEAMSGSTNAGEAFDLTATREAKDSTYAGIVRLVEAAQASKAPMSRLAERDALGSHARDELGISETVTAHPVQAALVSALPFAVGAVLPLIVALLSSGFSLFAHLANSTAV